MKETITNIYKITNLKNNYVYVGSTNKNLKERFSEHCKPSTWLKSPNSLFYKELNKFGKENFLIELLDTCFERHRFIIEEYWWNKLFDENFLMYEIKRGNSLSENTKKRISRLRNLEERDKKYHTEQFKNKVSQATSGELNGMYGKKDEEALNGRMVLAYKDKEHKKLIHTFNSMKVALKFLNIKGHSGLNKACRNNELFHEYYWEKEWIDR